MVKRKLLLAQPRQSFMQMRDCQRKAQLVKMPHSLSGFRYKDAPCSVLGATVAEGCSGSGAEKGEGGSNVGRVDRDPERQ